MLGASGSAAAGTQALSPAPTELNLELSQTLEGMSDVHAGVLAENHVVDVENFRLFYGKAQALHGINMKIPEGKVTALIGPSGCGKSTLLRSFNRLNDLVDGVRVEGRILFHGEPIHGRQVDVIELQAHGNGVSEIQPIPDVDFRKRGVRVAHRRRKSAAGSPRCASARFGEPRYGMKSKTGCTPAPWGCPADSSSGFASPAPSPESPKCC